MAEVGGSESNDSSDPNAGVPTGAASKVFISYPSQDAAVADTVCAALEAAGLPCWIAPRDVRAGESYAAAIVQAINSCRMLVLVLSKSAVDSPHVLREVERASSKKRPILSIRMDAAVLPPDLEYFLSANHWLDASGRPIERIIPALIEAVQGRAPANRNLVSESANSSGAGAHRDSSQASGRPGTQRPSRSGANRALIAFAAVLGLALAYFVADRFWLKRPRSPGGNEGAVSVMTSAPAAVSDKSIAVLPFTDMSEKRDEEYFSDGMAEEIIDLLVKVPELKVPARTSSFYFKGKSTKVPEIARELGVAHILEGSVRKSGDHLRVTAQLVRADNGYHLWSETYDRQLDDVFKVQDEIAGAVVKALKVSLLAPEAPSATPTTNSEAYELYLQARSLMNRDSEEDTLKAYEDLQRAVGLDPKFALAWAALADILTHDDVNWTRVFKHGDSASQKADEISLEDWGPIWAQVRAAAHAAAAQAIKLGPDLAESHAAMAQVLAWLDWDWAAADAELKRARELEPGNARVTLQAADIAIQLGRVSEGLELANRVAALDPLGHASNTIGWGQYVYGALDEAQSSWLKFINLYPTAIGAHFHYGLVLLARGDSKAALSAFQEEIGVTYRDVSLPLALDALGRRADADRAIASAEQKWANGMAYQIAYIYASRKDLDRTFYWLERAYRQHDDGLEILKIDPMFKNLAGDPRYKALLRKMRLVA